MLVRHGWSGETATNVWAKFIIELDEQDLARLLRTEGLVDLDPTLLSVPAAFTLLDGECERLVLVKLMYAYGYPAEKATARIRDLNAARARLLDILRAGDG